MKDEIKKTIIKYREAIPKKIFSRDLSIHEIKFDKATILVGPRKAGKSFFLYTLFNKEEYPIFINFEDSLISGIKSKDLNEILDSAKELYGLKKFSFFFDEIQNIPGWEAFIISLLNSHYSVFITGSNSNLLSKEIATSLRGKSLNYLFLPFSLSEYLSFNNLSLKDGWEYGDEKFKVKEKFNEFFKFGGFPEVCLSDSLELKNKLLNSYFDTTLYKDLSDRLNLKNTTLVQTVLKYLLNLFGNQFSISSLENYLKSNKISYSLEDVYSILKSSEDVFFCTFLRQYKKSFKKTEFSKSKIYLLDQGYIHFLAKESEDFGRILENIVFIELFRRNSEIENKNIFFFKSLNGKECDFIVKNNKKTIDAIQVCYALNSENRDRETNGLFEAMKEFNLKQGLILTFDQEDKYEIDGKKIIVKPVWKWLLEKI